MKELTIEQKAQRYDEGIEKLRNFYRDYDTVSCLIDVKEELANLFPELKESEESEDDSIRKELIEQVVYIVPNNDEVNSEGNVLPTYQKRIDKYRAWLEKQGEQEHLSHSCQDITELGRCAVEHEQKSDGWCENKKLYTIDVYYPTCGSEVKEAIEQGIAYCKTKKKEILISLNGIFLRITPSSTTENVLNEYNNCTGNNTVIKEKTNLINQWNNDDELYLKGVITDIECEVLCANCSREIADLKINWLKSLKDRVQSKQE